MGERPVYSGIFEYISELFDMDSATLPGSIRYRELIIAEQYDRQGIPVAAERKEFATPAEASLWVKERARALHADLVGVTRVNPDWIFEGGDVPGRYAIVVGARMDYGEIKTAPDLRAGMETTRAYYALGHIVHELADELRAAGHEAWAQHPRFSAKRHHSMVLPPHAIAAGLGRLGRNGLVLTGAFGPCVRWAAVTTDLELELDEPHQAEVLGVCHSCRECLVNCDAEAIPDEPAMVRGELKYKVLPMRCAHEFARTDGCSKCIAYCPLIEYYPADLRDVPPWTPTPKDGGPLP
jgi:hypothetical protein